MKSRICIDTSVIGGEFDTVVFFREIKDKLSLKMKGMTLLERKEFLRKLKSGEVKIAQSGRTHIYRTYFSLPPIRGDLTTWSSYGSSSRQIAHSPAYF